MLTRIYEIIWALVAVAAGIIYLSGNLSAIAVVTLGFVCFGMVFMGMISVLPATVSHHPSNKKADATPVLRQTAAKPARISDEGVSSAWLTVNGVEAANRSLR